MLLPQVGEVTSCGKCERKFLVERLLIGVSHTAGTYVTCWDCIDEETRQRVTARYQLAPQEEPDASG